MVVTRSRTGARNRTTPEQKGAFAVFTHLPPELRREIWLNTMHTPKVTEIVQRKQRGIGPTSPEKTITAPIGCLKPAALDTCRESREIALHEYKILSIENPKIEHFRIRDYLIFFNCHLDVLYLRMNQLIQPNFHFLDSKEGLYTCLRYLKLDARWVMGSSDRQTQIENIHSVLHGVQKFSSLKSLTLLGCEDPHALSEEIVQDALQEATEWRITDYSNWRHKWTKRLDSAPPGSASMPLLCSINVHRIY
jgi:hypothetical protein